MKLLLSLVLVIMTNMFSSAQAAEAVKNVEIIEDQEVANYLNDKYEEEDDIPTGTLDLSVKVLRDQDPSEDDSLRYDVSASGRLDGNLLPFYLKVRVNEDGETDLRQAQIGLAHLMSNDKVFRANLMSYYYEKFNSGRTELEGVEWASLKLKKVVLSNGNIEFYVKGGLHLRSITHIDESENPYITEAKDFGGVEKVDTAPLDFAYSYGAGLSLRHNTGVKVSLEAYRERDHFDFDFSNQNGEEAGQYSFNQEDKGLALSFAGEQLEVSFGVRHRQTQNQLAYDFLDNSDDLQCIGNYSSSMQNLCSDRGNENDRSENDQNFGDFVKNKELFINVEWRFGN